MPNTPTYPFAPPPGLSDMDGIPDQKEAWSRQVEYLIDGFLPTFGSTQLYNPRNGEPPGDCSRRKALWSALPQRLVNLHGLERAIELADEAKGWGELGMTASDTPFTGTPFVIPYRDQTEYCEWRVDRDEETGKIEKITFTCELIEYWWSLAQGYPSTYFNPPDEPRPPAKGNLNKVVELYRKHVSTDVRPEHVIFHEDVYGPDGTGGIMRYFAKHDYNPWNRWNTSDGLMHLTMPGNALAALLFLVHQTTVPRAVEDNGTALRHSLRLVAALGRDLGGHGVNGQTDRAITGVVGALARGGALITLDEAPCIQILNLDTRDWRVEKKPGLDFQQFWTVTRGDNVKKIGVRAELSIPKGEGFTISDIEIDNVPIRYGAQVAQCLTLGFGFRAHDFNATQPDTRAIVGEPAVALGSGALQTVPANVPEDPRYRKLFPSAEVSKKKPPIVDPTLDGDEIQGNILVGFNKDHQWFIGLDVVNPALARLWVASQAKLLAKTTEVAEHKARVKAEGVDGPKRTFYNLAMSHAGLLELGLAEAPEMPWRAYAEGMAGRGLFKARKGGTSKELEREPHLLAIIASDFALGEGGDEGPAKRIELVRDAGRHGLRLVFMHEGTNPLPGMDGGKEPFGFRDGVSQPVVRGRLQNGQPLTPRATWATGTDPIYSDENEPEYAKPGHILVWPGEFVLGYDRQNPVHPRDPAPPRPIGPEWCRNGSFVVYARFRQDVDGFWNDVKKEVGEDGTPGISPRALKVAARRFGRWPSGASLVAQPDADPGPNTPSSTDPGDNHFLYTDDALQVAVVGGVSLPTVEADPGGRKCPFNAHVRKVNPRDEAAEDGGQVGTLRRRIMRRGIAFAGKADGEEQVGLLFLCYQASIEDQFEFLWRHWMNDPYRPAGGIDPAINEMTKFVELREGGYFFSPSIKAVSSLGD